MYNFGLLINHNFFGGKKQEWNNLEKEYYNSSTLNS